MQKPLTTISRPDLMTMNLFDDIDKYTLIINQSVSRIATNLSEIS